MAEAFTNHLAKARGLPIRALSAGTQAGKTINPQAVAAMEEIGISMAGQHSKLLTQTMADSADRVVTMGCGVEADTCPARIYLSEDWGLDDPKNATIEQVRLIRDQIRDRVETLLSQMQEQV